MDDVIFSGQRQPPGAQHRRSLARRRQCRPHRAGRLQRCRAARDHPPHRARGRLGLPDQRPRRARPRRAAALRRRLDRRAFAGDGRPGQDRRADRRQAAATAARCSKRPPASPACTTAATRPSCGCAPPSRTSPALDDVIAEIEQQLDALKRQARQAVRYRNLSGEIRKAEATVLHLRWLAATEALARGRGGARRGGGARRRARRRAGATPRRRRRRPRRPCPTCATPRRAPARRCSASSRCPRGARRRKKRASGERLAELDRRLAQLGDDIAREERMVADNRAILVRLDEEERGLDAANAAMAERQAEAAARRADAPRRRSPRARRRSAS